MLDDVDDDDDLNLPPPSKAGPATIRLLETFADSASRAAELSSALIKEPNNLDLWRDLREAVLGADVVRRQINREDCRHGERATLLREAEIHILLAQFRAAWVTEHHEHLAAGRKPIFCVWEKSGESGDRLGASWKWDDR